MDDEKAEKIAKKIMFTSHFIGLMLIAAIRNGSFLYFADMYKVLGNILMKDDAKTSNAIAIAALFNIIGKLLAPTIWKKFGFYWSYNLIALLAILHFIIYLLFGIYGGAAIFDLISSARLILALCYITCYYTTFGLFHAKIAIYLGKVFDLNYFIGMVFTIVLNNYLFSQQNVVTIFVFFLIANVIGSVAFFLFFKDFEEKCKNYSN